MDSEDKRELAKLLKEEIKKLKFNIDVVKKRVEAIEASLGSYLGKDD